MLVKKQDRKHYLCFFVSYFICLCRMQNVHDIEENLQVKNFLYHSVVVHITVGIDDYYVNVRVLYYYNFPHTHHQQTKFSLLCIMTNICTDASQQLRYRTYQVRNMLFNIVPDYRMNTMPRLSVIWNVNEGKANNNTINNNHSSKKRNHLTSSPKNYLG
jgi:hypothetical protein